jgi:hypothetical protein
LFAKTSERERRGSRFSSFHFEAEKIGSETGTAQSPVTGRKSKEEAFGSTVANNFSLILSMKKIR